jgi:hypothetical protein
MTKYEFIGMRSTLYKLAGTLGTWNEQIDDINIYNAYDGLSSALDDLEELGYSKGWLDRSNNEIIED